MSRGGEASITHRGEPSAAWTGTESGQDGLAGQMDLARRLADVARDLQQRSDPQEVLDHVVTTAVAMVPGAQEGTITLARGRRRVVTAAATGDLPRVLDRCQEETGQGPCLDAVFNREVIRVDDLAAEERWPALAARARSGEIQARSMLAFHLFVQGDTLGSLDLVSTQTCAFSDESEQVGLLFASHAAVAVADAEELHGVRSALANRDVIGQAKGILMERFKITADQAFAVLSKASQDTNRKIHEVASELTRTGTLKP